MKRARTEELSIITSGLRIYPKIEQTLKLYDLGWTTKEASSYYLSRAHVLYKLHNHPREYVQKGIEGHRQTKHVSGASLGCVSRFVQLHY